MPLNPASIKNAQFFLDLLQQGVFPVQPETNIDLPLSFANVENIQEFVGTFTPEDNTFPLTPFETEIDINFMIVICDKQLNVLVTYGVEDWHKYVVQRFNFVSWFNDPTNMPTNIQLVGLNSNPYGMLPLPPQGVAVNYQIIVGKATLT